MRLTPVMFEVGARPHPPSELYRSYLAQSDIFVGIYWQSYGWVAPGEAISGIEDEYGQSGDRPRLIYVKEPSPGREAGLEALLERIRTDDRASYKRFESPGELAELVVDDLAVVLSERFAAAAGAAGGTGPSELPSGTLTFLFADIEGSTGIVERIGDSYADLLHRYHELIGGAVAARDGMVVDREGDGMFCVLDDAVAGAEAAVDIQRALAAGPLGSGVTVRARIGLHTGRAEVATDGYVGLDVHRAARIGSAANGGQILVSSAVRPLLLDVLASHEWQLRDLGSFALRGLARLERLFQLDAPGIDHEFPRPRAHAPATVRLPAQLTSLVGRDREIGEVASLLEERGARLVTLTGDGGIGKTRLALAVAERVASDYPDGVVFVDLADQHDGERVLPKLAEAAAVPVAGSPLESLAEAFAHRRALAVLDNFERVVSGGPAVARLVASCPGLHALVTSRVALRVHGEFECRVDPLDVPAAGATDVAAVTANGAVRLLVERARAVRPDFEVTADTAATVAAIARRLDGLPLAIELAAARLRLFSASSLLDQLDRSFDVLGRGPVDLPERQRTLRATLDWSHQLLTDDERAAFRRLTVFSSPWSLDAATEVCGGPDVDVVGLVESLVDKSLVRIDTDAEDAPRFRMLATVRDYGAERLRQSGDEPRMRAAHADHFLRVAERYGPWLLDERHEAAMRALDRQWDDVATALDRFIVEGRYDEVLRMAWRLWVYLWVRGHLGALEAADVDSKAAAALPPPERARLRCVMGNVAFEQGEYDRVLELVDGVFDLIDPAVQDEIVVWARFLRSVSLPAFGVDATTIVEELNDELRRLDSLAQPFWNGLGFGYLAVLETSHGAIDRAIEHNRRFLDAFERINVMALVAQAHTQLALAHLVGDDVARTREELTVAVGIHGSLVYWEGLSVCLDTLAALAMHEHDVNRAMVAAGAAEALRSRLGVKPWPSLRSLLDSVTHDAAAADTAEAGAARAAGRLMDPLTAATIALAPTPSRTR
jgi:predicted ATPase/class 3 adenylate cyclase